MSILLKILITMGTVNADLKYIPVFYALLLYDILQLKRIKHKK